MGSRYAHPEHAVLPNELDQRVRHRALGVALPVRLEIAQVTDMALIVGRSSVRFGEGVDWNQMRQHMT